MQNIKKDNRKQSIIDLSYHFLNCTSHMKSDAIMTNVSYALHCFLLYTAFCFFAFERRYAQNAWLYSLISR